MSVSIICEHMNEETLNRVLDILKTDKIKVKLEVNGRDNRNFREVDKIENSIKWTRGLDLVHDCPKWLF